MRDYNFFKDFKVIKVERDKRVYASIFTMLAVFLLIALLYSFNAYRISILSSRLEKLNDTVLTLKNNDDIMRVRDKVELERSLSDVVIGVDGAKNEIESYEIINENLLAIITDAIPTDVEVKTMYVSGGEINIAGAALSKPAIAEFQHNFVDSEIITDVFIPVISGAEGIYSFEAVLTIGGVDYENIQ